MKDEEIAEEFVNEKCKDCYMCTYSEYKNPYKKCQRRKDRKQAFLAGLKAGRQQWHDLRKDQNDLPKENQLVLMYRENPIGSNVAMSYWYQTYVNDKDLIAWCEIPTFDKE